MLASLTWLCLNLSLAALPINHTGDDFREAGRHLRQVISGSVIPHAPLAAGIRIAWDYQTRVRVSHSRHGTAGYSRMIQLHDGNLLCIYEADGSVFVTRSEDLGSTWQDPVSVAWAQDGIHMAAPDIIQLQDGSLLAMYNPRPWKISPRRTFGIRTRKSYDGGRTWIHGRLLHEAGHTFGDGAWEPAAVQMSDGEIRLFFADEGAFRKSDEQNISMLRSRDGGLTWTESPEIVSFRQGGRDGMPAPLILQNGDLVVAIEDTRPRGKMKPVIIRTIIGDNATTTVKGIDDNRWLALDDPQSLNTYAGAPYIRQLSTGETLMSFQGTQNRRNNALHSADMKVAIGTDQARQFNRVSEPFDIPRNRHALWNSITVLDDDTVIALASTNAYSFGRSEVWMIKGRVIPPLVTAQQTPGIGGNIDEFNLERHNSLPIFVGRNSNTHLRAGVAADKDNLYVTASVKDADIHTGYATIDNNDGVCFSITSTTLRGVTDGPHASLQPAPGVYQITVSADNQLIVKTGSGTGRWSEVPHACHGVHHQSRKTRTGYDQEITIPLKLIGLSAEQSHTPGTSASAALNVTLIENTGNNVPKYRESISSTNEDDPSSWLPLTVIAH